MCNWLQGREIVVKVIFKLIRTDNFQKGEKISSHREPSQNKSKEKHTKAHQYNC